MAKKKDKTAVYDESTARYVLDAAVQFHGQPLGGFQTRIPPKVSGGNSFVLAKAKVESGTYPTLQSWSEGTTFTPSFQLGKLSESGTDSFPRDPNSDWVADDPATYVKVYNFQRHHYIPENAYCWLWKQQGTWFVDYSMPNTIYGSLDALLNSSTSALLTVLTTGGFGGTSAKCMVHLNFALGTNLLAGTKVYAQLMPTSSRPRYEVTAVDTCPTIAPAEEE